MERKSKIGIILLIIGVVLLGASLCMIVGSEAQKSIENTKVVGNIVTGEENLEAYAKKLAIAIEPLNPDVRSYALSSVNSDSGGEFNISQVCDIFDAINSNWSYVEDPRGYDYFAKASESVPLLKGDCDDFALLMASCISAVGGEPRVNIAYGLSGGHAYAEVFIGNTLYDVNRIVSYIKERYGCENVYYTSFTDDYGNTSYWLNLDWWENHPGGTYFESIGEVLAVHPDGTHYYYTLKWQNDTETEMTQDYMPEYFMPNFWDTNDIFDEMEDLFYSLFFPEFMFYY